MIDIVLLALFLSTALLAFHLGRIAVRRGRTLGKAVTERNQLQWKLDGSYVFDKIAFENAEQITAGGILFKRVEVEVEEEWPEFLEG